MPITRDQLQEGTPYRMESSYFFQAGDIVYLVYDDGSDCPKLSRSPDDTRYSPGAYYVSLDRLEPVSETATNKGEEAMTNEEQVESTPEYIIITRNTDMFKKGAVFKNYSSFWSPEKSTADTYIAKPYATEYITPEHGKVLLDKKIAVPALKFNPEFVTLGQNEALLKALEPAKKVTKKATPKKKA